MTTQEKAQVAINARDAGAVEWLRLVFALVARTGLSPRQVEIEIENLANGMAKP